jgi:hypothetical protein
MAMRVTCVPPAAIIEMTTAGLRVFLHDGGGPSAVRARRASENLMCN